MRYRVCRIEMMTLVGVVMWSGRFKIECHRVLSELAASCSDQCGAEVRLP